VRSSQAISTMRLLSLTLTIHRSSLTVQLAVAQ